jgi:formylglycine-generating enzyme required for sulfatase activity
MKKLFFLNGLAFIFLTLFSVSLSAQSGPRYALVIGNASYTNIGKLTNTVNDVRDITAALTKLGYKADLKIDLGERQFAAAIDSYVAKLKSNRNSEGFFWYAGHAVQIKDQNYLLPVDIRIESERSVERGAFSLDGLLRDFEDAHNKVNIIILDACRNNPFPSTSRSAGTRGLATVDVPGDLFIMFSTAPGDTAADGDAGKRNSPFAEAFLKHINSTEIVSLMATDVANETMALTGGKQRPFLRGSIISEKYYSLNPAPASRPAAAPAQNAPARPAATQQPAAKPATARPAPAQQPAAAVSTGTVTVTSEIAGAVLIDGADTGQRIKAQGTVAIQNVSAGQTEVAVRGDDGKLYRLSQPVTVRQGQSVSAILRRPVPAGFARINGGTFTMGSPASEVSRGSDETQRQVTVSGFYMGKYEVTQAEYEAVTGTNPSYFKGSNLPVEQVSWYDAIEYCNKRSVKEGLTPAYTRNGDSVTWNRNATGYRLPTEAEWEYACRGGTGTPFSTGNNITTSQANYNGNNPYNNNAKGAYRGKTWAAGSGTANSWGLYDMHGNVWEWCWDWYGPYDNGARTDPAGASSGAIRVNRGGGWGGYAQNLRSANRGGDTPSSRHYILGFRLVRQ